MVWGHEDDEREQREAAEWVAHVEAEAELRDVDLADEAAAAELEAELEAEFADIQADERKGWPR